jgi:hypothetical protein
VLGDTRDHLARHTFVGGNAHMLRLLNRYRAELGVTAQPAELEAAAAATERQLQRDTATLALTTPQIRDGALEFDVVIRNLTGHKFPTGYPSRRAWLHATVVDGSGRPLFESGAIDADGAIAGNDSDADARRFEPHHSLITDAAQVPIYESILGTPAGAPTTGLLSATQYLKDNRLLPRGFDKRTASLDIAVVGGALDDDDFSSEGDRVRYRVAVPAGENFAVRVELRYQSIAFRWAANLAGYDAAEPRRFTSYYQSTAAGSSIIVASACAATGSRSNDESGSC